MKYSEIVQRVIELTRQVSENSDNEARQVIANNLQKFMSDAKPSKSLGLSRSCILVGIMTK